MEGQKTKFSGWAVLVGCILLMIFAAGLTAFTIGNYMYPICEEFGFLNTEYSIAVTVTSLVNALTSFFLVGSLAKGSKQRMKLIMLVCAVITGVGYFCCAFCAELWQFIVMYAVWNIGFNLLTYTPVSMMINNWFPTKSALFTGIAFAGGNVGGAIFNIVLSGIINASGWRQAFMTGGVFCLVGSVVGILLVKRSPSEYGQKPYGEVAKAQDGAAAAPMWEGVTKKQALKSPAIYLLAVSMLITGIYAGGVANHAINALCTDGWTVTAAAMVMTIYSLCGIGGNVLSAGVVNKLGVKKSVPIFALITAAAIVCLMLAGATTVFGYVFAVLFGLACVLTALIPTQAVAVIFGTKEYAGIYGFVYTFYLIGCTVGSPLIAIFADRSGYKLAWIVVAIMIIVLIFTYFACFKAGASLRNADAADN